MEKYVTILGGANIDIVGKPYDNLNEYDSNPGRVKISFGGVGRNIAENLVKLGISTKLITAFGDDYFGKILKTDLNNKGIDISTSFTFSDSNNSIYLALLDKEGEMVNAINDMEIYNKVTIDLIKDKVDIINNSHVCVIDTNIPIDVIEFMVKTCTGTTFFLDPVSTVKALKIKHLLPYFHTIKPNRYEAEVLSDIKIDNVLDLPKVTTYFTNQGVKRVFISLGREGVYYGDKDYQTYYQPKEMKITNASGAGDAYLAALVYAYINKFSIEETLRFAQGASYLTLMSEDTVSTSMSVSNIKKILQEMEDGKCIKTI